jgi:hypothetical protein
MKPFTFKLGLMAAGLVMTAWPALAGQRPNPGGGGGGDRAVDRPATSGPSGNAASNNGGGGSASGGSTSGSSTSSSSPSAGAASSPSFSSADRSAPVAAEPQHRRPSGGSSSGSGERAVPRGSGSSSPSPSSGSSNGGRTTSSTAGTNNNASNPSGDRAVPSWSRPRGDRPASGTAVERTTPPYRGHGSIGGGRYYYDPYFPYGYAYPAYGFGLGFGLYDPWYDPFLYGGYGYGGYGYGGYGAGYGTSSPYSYGAQDYSAPQGEGSIRLKVKPNDAKVYVDGYFVGTVDNFDGAFQKLKIPAGRHHIEVKADGFEPAAFDTTVAPDQTLTYQGDLKRIQ